MKRPSIRKEERLRKRKIQGRKETSPQAVSTCRGGKGKIFQSERKRTPWRKGKVKNKQGGDKKGDLNGGKRGGG